MNSVFVKVNAAGCVVAVDSDAFLSDTNGWVKVDEGEGDRYVLAQGLYLPEPMLDGERRYRYKVANGAVAERTAAELAADALPAPTVEAVALLQAQVQALTERGEFMEDCIAEMAAKVYGG